MPHPKYDREGIEVHKPKIQAILGVLIATTPVAESRTFSAPHLPNLYGVLIIPRFVPLDSITPACKRLVRRMFTPYELSSLIEAIFSSEGEINMVHFLCGNDAQTFIDVIDEVCSTLPLTSFG